jgi:hypothetical protein
VSPDKLPAFLITLSVLWFLFITLPNRAKRKYQKLAREEMESLYDVLEGPVEEFQFYGRGHPYVWTEFSKEVAENIVLRSCAIWPFPGSPFWVYTESQDYLYPRQDLKHIYILPRGQTIEDCGLMHYEAWLSSEKEVSEKIAQFKKNS